MATGIAQREWYKVNGYWKWRHMRDCRGSPCDVCGNQLDVSNTTGVCRQTQACRDEAQRRLHPTWHSIPASRIRISARPPVRSRPVRSSGPTCDVCLCPIGERNTSGVCSRTQACRREGAQRYKETQTGRTKVEAGEESASNTEACVT